MILIFCKENLLSFLKLHFILILIFTPFLKIFFLELGNLDSTILNCRNMNLYTQYPVKRKTNFLIVLDGENTNQNIIIKMSSICYFHDILYFLTQSYISVFTHSSFIFVLYSFKFKRTYLLLLVLFG